MRADAGSRRLRYLIAEAAAITLALLLPGSVRQSMAFAEGSLPIDPLQGRAGTSVVVAPDLANFSKCAAWWGHDPPVTFACGPSDGGGSLSTTIVVPEGTPPGRYLISACEPAPYPCENPDGAWEGSAEFTVLTVVPHLVGDTVDEARRQLKEASLYLGDIEGPATDPDARVTLQSLPAESPVAPSIEVNVTVAVPTPDLIPVPDLRGDTVHEAIALLRENRLVLGPVSGSGVVTSQDPPARTPVARGFAVGVSLQPKVVLVTVPDVRHRRLRVARNLLSAAGLVMQSGIAMKGIVDGQAPAAGTSVPRGSTITVTVTVPASGSSHDPPITVIVGASVLALLLLGGAVAWIVRARRPRPPRPVHLLPHARLHPGTGDVTISDVGESKNHTVEVACHSDSNVVIERSPR
jgi:beta-lactam-binding protein with PASTA domain